MGRFTFLDMYQQDITCHCGASTSKDFYYCGFTLEEKPYYQCRNCGGSFVNTAYGVGFNPIRGTVKPRRYTVLELFYKFDRVRWDDILILLHEDNIDNRACYYAIFRLDGEMMYAEYVANDRDSLAQHNLASEAREFNYSETLKHITTYRSQADSTVNPVLACNYGLLTKFLLLHYDGPKEDPAEKTVLALSW